MVVISDDASVEISPQSKSHQSRLFSKFFKMNILQLEDKRKRLNEEIIKIREVLTKIKRSEHEKMWAQLHAKLTKEK